MVDVGILYRYEWRGEPRALHAHLLDDVVTVHEADPVSCEHTERVGTFAWADGAIVGDGLSDTRRRDIAALLTAALSSQNPGSV